MLATFTGNTSAISWQFANFRNLYKMCCCVSWAGSRDRSACRDADAIRFVNYLLTPPTTPVNVKMSRYCSDVFTSRFFIICALLQSYRIQTFTPSVVHWKRDVTFFLIIIILHFSTIPLKTLRTFLSDKPIARVFILSFITTPNLRVHYIIICINSLHFSLLLKTCVIAW